MVPLVITWLVYSGPFSGAESVGPFVALSVYGLSVSLMQNKFAAIIPAHMLYIYLQ